MLIRHSTIEDLPDIMTLVSCAREIMRRDGNLLQWSDGHPSIEQFRADIAQGVSYLMKEKDMAVGTFAFMPGPDVTYGRIDGGQWLNDDPYSVVHRIASRSETHGIFGAMLNFCLATTDNIRIDTHRDNHIMQHLLRKHGFAYCGIIYLLNGDERLAFQWCKGEASTKE